jgi:hypothetical protein
MWSTVAMAALIGPGTEATVFPQGVHYKGGNYGKDVNLPVTQPEENNPNFKGCTDRNP